MRGLWRDVVFGCRGFARKPGFTAAALASLMLGIGTCTAIFALLDAIFLRPLPLSELDRLVAVYGTLRNQADEYAGEQPLSYPVYRDLRERNRSFSQLALYHWWPMSLTGGSEPQRVTGMFVSGNYFDLLGIAAARGRVIEPRDDEKTSDPVAVLTHGCWQRLFGGESGAVGRTLAVNGQPMTIVGVAPPGFRGTEMLASVDVFIPLATFERVSPFGSWFENRGVALFPALGKLRPDVSVEKAHEEIHDLARRLADEYHETLEGRLGGKVAPLAASTIPERFRDRYQGYAMRLLIVLVILLIACLSVANLLFVRGVERARELSVRQALGAGRGRLVRQLLTENLVLFLLGGLGGLAVARLSLTVLWALRPPDVPATALDLRLDVAVWAVAVGAALALGLAFGLWPALRAARADLVSNLKESEPLAGARGLPLLLKPRSLVVVLQVALALVALIGCGLLLRSLERIFAIDLGFDSERLAVVTVSPGEQGFEQEQAREIYRALLERTRALPGVEAAALSENRLLRGAVMRREVYLPGSESASEIAGNSRHRVNTVGAGLFATAGINLLRGRDFRDDEPADQLVAIVNETMAKGAWPGAEAIGQRFHFDYPNTPPIEVVGVVADAKYREVREEDQFFVYVPLDQHFASTMTLHVRAAGAPAALLETLAGVVREIDPNLVVADLRTMDDFVADALWLERTSTKLLGGFGLLALGLAVIGVYGLVAYSVSRRQRELGIQIALGARRGRLLAKVLLEALQVVTAGVVLGLATASIALEPIMASQLYGVDVIDAPTYLVGPLVLLVAAGLGSLLPAWRAARTDPIETLRTE
jgi:predicted permease